MGQEGSGRPLALALTRSYAYTQRADINNKTHVKIQVQVHKIIIHRLIHVKLEN